MYISVPVRIGILLLVVVLAVTVLVVDQFITLAAPVSSHLDYTLVHPVNPAVFPLKHRKPEHKKHHHHHPLQPGVKPGITVAPNVLQETTDGYFVTTIYGQGLQDNTYYTLTDDNKSCPDSVNIAVTSILTDLDGHFEYPFYSMNIVPCATGQYSVTATGPNNTIYPTSFILNHPKSVTPNLVIAPRSVPSTTTGSFATSIYVYGLQPSTKYVIADDFTQANSCTTSLNAVGGTAEFKTDNAGNAEMSWYGGPDFTVGSSICAPGLHTIQVTNPKNGNVIYQATLTLTPIHP